MHTENVRINDRVGSKDLLSKNKFLSVNQTMAQIKITEMWKAKYTTHNPLKILPLEIPENGRIARSNTNGPLQCKGLSTLSQNTFIEDSKRVWNSAPDSTKHAKSLISAKKEIKIYYETLPI